MSDKEPSSDKKDPVADLSAMLGMGGLLEGMSSLISKFGDLAERGESLHKTMGETQTGKPYQSSVGFSVKFGPGGHRESADSSPITPVSVPKRAKADSTASHQASRQTSLQTREPNVDVFEEEDHLLLVAEMPGVATDAIELVFADKRLVLEGQSKTAIFKKELELPRAYTREQVTISANNGVIEIRLDN